MERFTVKKVIYMLFATIFLFVLTQTVKVEAFEDDFFSVERIDGLVYGEPISKAKIVLGEDCVAGTVYFMHPDRVANTVGPVSVWITFAPEDSDTYGEPFSLPVDAVVEKRSIEIVFATPIYKHYDGTDEVVFPGYEYQGVLKQDEDKISIDGTLVGKYSGTYVAEEVPITLSGISLSGEKKDCYELVLTGHSGTIHPTQIRDFLNEVSIGFDNSNFLDISTTVTVKKNSPIVTINDEYTSFLEYRFVVYDHNYEEIEVSGKYTVGLTIKQEILSKERLEVFECLSDDVCKKLNYTYNNGVMYFEMDPDSKIIFTTRNVEYGAIMLFCGVLVVSFVSVVIYWIANITKSYASEEEEE